jgi:hypothetical protein
MERREVKSTVIKSVGYDLDTSTLEVELAGKKQIRQYLQCPQYLFIEMIQSPSIGKYFLKHIKGQLQEIKLDI